MSWTQWVTAALGAYSAYSNSKDKKKQQQHDADNYQGVLTTTRTPYGDNLIRSIAPLAIMDQLNNYQRLSTKYGGKPTVLGPDSHIMKMLMDAINGNSTQAFGPAGGALGGATPFQGANAPFLNAPTGSTQQQRADYFNNNQLNGNDIPNMAGRRPDVNNEVPISDFTRNPNDPFGRDDVSQVDQASDEWKDAFGNQRLWNPNMWSPIGVWPAPLTPDQQAMLARNMNPDFVLGDRYVDRNDPNAYPMFGPRSGRSMTDGGGLGRGDAGSTLSRMGYSSYLF